MIIILSKPTRFRFEAIPLFAIRSPQAPSCPCARPGAGVPRHPWVPPPSPWQRAGQWRVPRMFTGRGVAAATREASRSRYLTPRRGGRGSRRLGGHGPARPHRSGRHGLPRHPRGFSFTVSFFLPTFFFFLNFFGIFFTSRLLLFQKLLGELCDTGPG